MKCDDCIDCLDAMLLSCTHNGRLDAGMFITRLKLIPYGAEHYHMSEYEEAAMMRCEACVECLQEMLISATYGRHLDVYMLISRLQHNDTEHYHMEQYERDQWKGVHKEKMNYTFMDIIFRQHVLYYKLDGY